MTDGYLERNAAQVDIDAILLRSHSRHPRQIVQELATNVLTVTSGGLRDDATALCLDWLGSAGRRDATGGASSTRATAASPSADST